jgi:hypothetical protein
MRKLESHYRQENGVYLIEIGLNNIDQIWWNDRQDFTRRIIYRRLGSNVATD